MINVVIPKIDHLSLLPKRLIIGPLYGLKQKKNVAWLSQVPKSLETHYLYCLLITVKYTF